ncbi:MAG: hotdog fold thioesterase [Fibrobacteres bacterium]|nr:hotdog fold thioesterase [Fibrobacterota bacterium]
MDLEKFKKFINTNDRFAASNGMSVIEVRPGIAKASLTVCENHLNGVNIIQGGALFTLADLAFAAASNAHGLVAVGLTATISFFKPGLTGDILTAEAKEVNLTARTACYNVDITNNSGVLIAQFNGIAYRKKESIDEKF